jgi:hypothetical protein
MSLNYRIYPSLLDKYQSLLDYEQAADEPWNKVSAKAAAEGIYAGKSEGDYIYTPDEMYDRLAAELLAQINREPQEPSEAADRGTALNEVVDCMLLHRKTERDKMVIQTQYSDREPISVRVDYDGFTFNFDVALCRQLASMLQGSMCQYYAHAVMPTSYGDVELYGYPDYWRRGSLIDLKTTSSYSFGKYQRYWQRYAYPYMCLQSGMTRKVDDFTFLAVELHKGAVLTGRIYPEVYSYRHDRDSAMLHAHVESFCDWLNCNRDKITDKKIFNNE